MSRVRGHNTSPERRLRSALWGVGLRYRLGEIVCSCRPDIVFPGPKVVVFVDGCFWHGCPDHYVNPRTRRRFWAKKLSDNVERDRRQTWKLEQDGWSVIRIWEHEVFENVEQVVRRVVAAVQNNERDASTGWRVYKVDVLDEESDTERRSLISLRSPGIKKDVEKCRSTAKWKRLAPD